MATKADSAVVEQTPDDQTNPQPSDASAAPVDQVTYEVTMFPGRPLTTDVATYNEHKSLGLVAE